MVSQNPKTTRPRAAAAVGGQRARGLFKPVAPPVRAKLSDSIVGQIEKLILDGTLKPGDPLPAERGFAEEFGVSRPSLREAILRLEARGLVRVRPGGGYAVADVATPLLTGPLVHLLQQHPPAAQDILELRRALEEMASGLAAERATDADRALITRRYETLLAADEVHGDPLQNSRVDMEFHIAIADASHNVALIHVMRGLCELLLSSAYKIRRDVYAQDESLLALMRRQHREIYEAIMAADAPRARAAAAEHLTSVVKLRQIQNGRT
jgi:GntR family transcriptional regulator, transcriptional repressor for pyruvate dehydrogenase complex